MSLLASIGSTPRHVQTINGIQIKYLKEWAADRSFEALFPRAQLLIDPLLEGGSAKSPKLNRNKLACDIVNLISNRYYAWACRPPSAARLRDRFAKIGAAIVKAQGAIKSCDEAELEHLRVYYDSSINPFGAPDLRALRLGLDQLEAVAKVKVQDLNIVRQAPDNLSLAWLVRGRVTSIYKHHFGGEVRISRRSADREPSGPFVRFAEHPLQETNPFDGPPPSRETIVAALKGSARRKASNSAHGG